MLIGAKYGDVSKIYDHRYFYVKEGCEQCVCGIAREFSAEQICKEQMNQHFLEPIWIDNFANFHHNPGVLGFLVEQTCLTIIEIRGFQTKKATTTFHFDNAAEAVSRVKAMTSDCYLGIPKAFNFKAIDALLVDYKGDVSGQGTIKGKIDLMPIQITISENHSNSEEKFWDEWLI